MFYLLIVLKNKSNVAGNLKMVKRKNKVLPSEVKVKSFDLRNERKGRLMF